MNLYKKIKVKVCWSGFIIRKDLGSYTGFAVYHLCVMKVFNLNLSICKKGVNSTSPRTTAERMKGNHPCKTFSAAQLEDNSYQ